MSAPQDRPGPSDTGAGRTNRSTARSVAHAGPGALGDVDAGTETDAAEAAAREVQAEAGRSTVTTTCPYLRLAAADGTLGRPSEIWSDDHRCIAMGEPTALSERQRSLVCLTASHEDCPRYLRAILVVPVTEPVVAATRRVHPATLVATILLAVAAVIAIAFTAAVGGITMPVASTSPAPGGSGVAAASPTPSTLPSRAPSPTPTASATAVASASLEPSPSPSPTAVPSLSPTPRPSPRPSATPRPTSDRYALLEPCPDKPDCYVYTVRAGDNLVSIANYFGVPLSTVYRLNPWARTTGLRAGQHLVLPPPTR